jgi:methylated-DNA-[protein]-cysteine S-methyltransferase
MKLLQESPIEFLEPLSKPPEKLYVAEVPGPFGSALISGTSDGVVHVRMNVSIDRFSEDLRNTLDARIIKDDAPLRSAIEWLRAYFHGEPITAHVRIQPYMTTVFTLQVHRALTRIPHGQTISYGELATEIDRPRAARAVGSANGRNPVLIIVPCHRVLAANGLGGFGAGLDLKRSLLSHEGIRWKNSTDK